MSARSRMTMRAFTKREYTSGTDDYGQPIEVVQKYLSDVPCFFWYPTGGGEHLKYEQRDTLILDTPRMIVPTGTDIVSGDLIEKIQDRRYNDLFGAYKVDSVRPRSDHLDVILSEVK